MPIARAVHIGTLSRVIILKRANLHFIGVISHDVVKIDLIFRGGRNRSLGQLCQEDLPENILMVILYFLHEFKQNRLVVDHNIYDS